MTTVVDRDPGESITLRIEHAPRSALSECLLRAGDTIDASKLHDAAGELLTGIDRLALQAIAAELQWTRMALRFRGWEARADPASIGDELARGFGDDDGDQALDSVLSIVEDMERRAGSRLPEFRDQADGAE